MASFQSIAAALLLETGASRAMLQLARPEGGFDIVAEAVTHGARQIRKDADRGGRLEPPAQVARERQTLAVSDVAQADAPLARALAEPYGVRALIAAPLVRRDRLAGIVAVHDAREPRRWEERELEAVRGAQAAALAALEEREARTLATIPEDLRDAALQALLDRLRQGLRVQRCTLRQNVSSLYAFPVTHESRGEDVWSLYGDFTIVQSGQPVIEKLLAERAQVVQNDTRAASTEPLFHVMLKHYGDLRAQIVTPLFREDSLAAVLSVHSLKELRSWTREETALARQAARLMGLLIGATLA